MWKPESTAIRLKPIVNKNQGGITTVVCRQIRSSLLAEIITAIAATTAPIATTIWSTIATAVAESMKHGTSVSGFARPRPKTARVFWLSGSDKTVVPLRGVHAVRCWLCKAGKYRPRAPIILRSGGAAVGTTARSARDDVCAIKQAWSDDGWPQPDSPCAVAPCRLDLVLKSYKDKIVYPQCGFQHQSVAKTYQVCGSASQLKSMIFVFLQSSNARKAAWKRSSCWTDGTLEKRRAGLLLCSGLACACTSVDNLMV